MRLEATLKEIFRRTFLGLHPRFTFHIDSIIVVRRWGQKLAGALLLGGASLFFWFDVELVDEPSTSWAMIDVASHPSKTEVLLQGLSTDLGGHALVYDVEIVLWDQDSF